MPIRQCPYPGCTYATEDVTDALAAEYFAIHRTAHTAAAPVKQKPPEINRPRIDTGSSEEVWNTFNTRWTMFKRGTTLTADETVQQLFQCCSDALGDAIIKGYPTATSGTEAHLSEVIKKLAVVPVARVVRRMEVLSMKQDHGETTRSYQARLTGKASTCGYNMVCSSDTCNVVNDFANVIIKDVLIHGLVDEEIKKDVVGWADVDDKTVEETVKFAEAKEMARDATNKPVIAAAPISTKLPKDNNKSKSSGKDKDKIRCPDCNVLTDKFFWHRKRQKRIECTKCRECWQKDAQPQRSPANQDVAAVVDETSALLIGAMSNITAPEKRYRLYGVNVPNSDPSLYLEPPSDPPVQTEVASTSNPRIPQSDQGRQSPIILDHHIFDSKSGWRRSESMAHPSLRLRVSTEQEDYNCVGAAFPDVMPSYVSVVTDNRTRRLQLCWYSIS